MVDEAHDTPRRCVRTRKIGLRMLPVAWEQGARLLAMEALDAPGRDEGYLPYMRQPEMRGDTAGFLVRGTRRETLGVDAWLLSMDNTME